MSFGREFDDPKLFKLNSMVKPKNVDEKANGRYFLYLYLNKLSSKWNSMERIN